MTEIKQPIGLIGGLENYLVLFEPEEHLPKIVKDVRDIYAQRALLRDISGSAFAVDFLAAIILGALESKARFRKYYCLKVLRSVVRNSRPEKLNTNITHKLFKIYQAFIFTENEEIQWCVSALVKDQLLSSEDIGWLVENYKRSNHIVNRLLRYPKPTASIQIWADIIRRSNELADRRSEVIGLLLPERFEELQSSEDENTLVWAVYYSRVSDPEKENMLTQLAGIAVLDSLLDVSLRLRYPKPLKKLISIIKNNG